MNKNDGSNGHFVSPGGVEYEIAGYRLEGDDWRDVEAGAPLPSDSELDEIDLITINLRPDSDDGFYRAADIIAGFDVDYEIGDLVDVLDEAYGHLAT